MISNFAKLMELAGIKADSFEAAAFKAVLYVREVPELNFIGCKGIAVVPHIPSANDMWASKSRRTWDLSEKYKAWLDEAKPIFAVALGRQTVPVRVRILRLIEPNGRMNYDIDNLCKPTIDGLVKAGVLHDDRVGYVMGAHADAALIQSNVYGSAKSISLKITHDIVALEPCDTRLNVRI